MIIRHGFIRDYEGCWHNMKMVRNIYVREFFGENSTFAVIAEMKTNDDYWTQVMSKEHEFEYEAQEILDDAFGFTG